MTTLQIRISSLGLLGIILLWTGCSLNVFGKVPFSEYSEAKRKAYYYLTGLSPVDMTHTPPPPLPPNLSEAGRNSRTTGLMDETIKEGLYEILGDDGLRESWSVCFHELGVWSTVSPDKGDFERLRRFVEKIEISSMEESEKMNYLPPAYYAVGRIGTPEAKAFLRERMRRDFWGDTMPQADLTFGPAQTIVQTAQSEATAAYGIRGDDDSIAYLKSLAQKPEVQNDSELSKVIRYNIDTAADQKLRVEQDQAFYRHVRGEVKPPSSGIVAGDIGANHRLRSILLIGIPACIVVLLLVRAYRGRMTSKGKS
jgi:hypothetical protein